MIIGVNYLSNYFKLNNIKAKVFPSPKEEDEDDFLDYLFTDEKVLLCAKKMKMFIKKMFIIIITTCYCFSFFFSLSCLSCWVEDSNYKWWYTGPVLLSFVVSDEDAV